MNYLFRYPPNSHVFITPEDPGYRYDVLCGHCGYPIDRSDRECPRCQRELENCPVCSNERHTKSVKVQADPKTGGKTCPVCCVTRIPFGERRISEITGSFCTNIYGCPAGGFLLKTEEFAVLPASATLCPICRNEDLLPADVKTFTHLLNICWFCNTSFGTPDDWKRGWAALWNPSLERVREASRSETDPPCRLCGRNDQRVKEQVGTPSQNPSGHEQNVKGDLQPDRPLLLQSFVLGPEGKKHTNVLEEKEYLRVTELGRILVLEREDEEAFRRAFDAWFSPVYAHSGEVTVRRVTTELLEGTLCTAQRRIIQKRLDLFVQAWERKLPNGLDHRIPEERQPEKVC